MLKSLQTFSALMVLHNKEVKKIFREKDYYLNGENKFVLDKLEAGELNEVSN